jgi:hypothetical protein
MVKRERERGGEIVNDAVDRGRIGRRGRRGRRGKRGRGGGG